MRRAPFASLTALALAGCGDPSGPAVTTTNSGGAGGSTMIHTGGAAGSAGSGGSITTTPPPDCRGTPFPTGDVLPAADGRSIDVACDGASLHVSVIDDAVIRLRARGSAPPIDRPSYAVVGAPDPTTKPLFGSTADKVLVCTTEWLLEIARADCHLRALDATGAVRLEDAPEGGYFEGQGLGRGVTRVAPPGERYYGFGEKTGPLDKRGRVMTFWNTDAYVPSFGGYPPDADPLYASIPFFITLAGGRAHGLFLDDTHRLRFDMAASDPARITLSTAGRELDQTLIAGPEMRDVVARYTALTGRMPLPPRWSLGYHQSRWGYSPDTEVLAVAAELRSRNLPSDALWLDIQHLDGFRSFTWDQATFPDPPKLVHDLGAMGFRAVSIVDPGIKVDPGYDIYAEALAQGLFVTRGGAPYVGEVWPGAASFPDFTSPAARAWWSSLVTRETDAGVAGLWIDMNEPSNFVMGTGGTVPEDAMCAGDGFPSTMAELHNVYALNEARATYEGLRAALPDQRPFVLTRAGYAGIQRYAAMWTGDAPSTWETLRGSLPMLLGMGLSGLAFAGTDVGGYSGNASPELFARWMELGSFSPFFRGHVTSGVPPQEPWQFGTEPLDISRAVMASRYRLLPYLYSLFWEASQTGSPILRPLVYEHQADPGSAAVDDQAMLGPSLMVAPVLTEGATTRQVYFPPGRWFEARSGAIIDGPATRTVAVTLGALPTYVREGAIVPRFDEGAVSTDTPSATKHLDIYPSSTETRFTLYEDDGLSRAFEAGASARITYSLQRSATSATLTVSPQAGNYPLPKRALLVRAHRVDHGVTGASIDGQSLPAFPDEAALLAANEGYFYDDRDLSLVIKTPDRAGFTLVMDYDPSIVDPAPPVQMRFVVDVPPGTPTSSPIHIATDASGWTHQPLSWEPGMTRASGLVPVPRGDWVFYKYTRGDWATVEKWPACVEATNRYELGAAHPDKRDTVFAWADACP